MQETVGVNYFRGGLGHFIIPFHYIIPPATHFTLDAHRALFIRFRIQNLDFNIRKLFSYCGCPDFRRIIRTALGHSRGSLRKTVNAGYFLHVHFVHNLLHQFHRAQRTGHDSGAEAGHIKHVEHGMIQFSDEHCGNTVNCRAFFFMHRGKGHKGIKAFKKDMGCAVGKDSHNAQNNPETMEQGHRQTNPLSVCIFHALAD